MGYISVYGACFICSQPFLFSPSRVPSIRDGENERQPVCRGCMTTINAKRREAGLAPFPIMDGAYEGDEE